MHVLIGKKQIILSALVLVLGLAVFVNWYFTDTKKPFDPEGTAQTQSGTADGTGKIELVNATAEDYFATVRVQRSTSRDESVNQLKEAIATASPDSDSTVQVNAMINAISTASQRETDIEAMINASLGSECVAVISGDTVEVVVDKNALNDESVLKITDIIGNICNNEYENIRICAAMS